MSPSRFSASLPVVLAGLGVGLCFLPSIVRAQNTVNAPVLVQGDPAPSAAAGRRAQNTPTRTRTVSDVATAMNRGTSPNGVFVVADSATGATPAALPTEATTPTNVEKQIAALVAKLPPGTLWAKLYLPAPVNARRGYNGDDVAAYALAQSKLVGTVGAALPPGTVEIMGQKLPQEKADAFIAGLNLKPVYLITNPRAQAPDGFGLLMDVGRWPALSPEKKEQYNIMIRLLKSGTLEEQQRLLMQGTTGPSTRIEIPVTPVGPPTAP